jgi:hypothetical protein
LPLRRGRATFGPVRWLIVLVVAVSFAGCGGAPTDDSAEGAARLFVEAMERSASDRRGLEEAYHLLSEPTRQRLVARARMTAALGAAEREPWEMLVEGTAHVRFMPRPGGFREHVDAADPNRATVTVSGSESGQVAELPLVREDDGWRVVLDVPELTAPSE